MIKNISINELLPIIDKVNLIDIRSVNKYNDNHIPNARNILKEQLLLNPGKYLKTNEIYYIYCQKGLNSINVVNYLNRKGYNTVNIKGGYEEWLLER